MNDPADHLAAVSCVCRHAVRVLIVVRVSL